MSSSILDLVGQQLGGNTVGQISQQIGSDPNSTAQAIQMALPMLVGGLAHNAQNPQGAAALDSALDSHDPGLLDNVAGFLGGGAGGGGAAALGGLLGGGGGGGGLGGMLGSVLAGGAAGKILGHVLGGRQPGVEQGIGRATGLNQGQVGKLLLILAPLVMAALAKRRQQAQQTGGGGVGEVLQQERQQVEERSPALGGVLGKIFGAGSGQSRGRPVPGGVDLDGDGIADEIGRVSPGSLGGLLGGLLGGR
jgi:hypothetical protein